jgi:sialic acid synthase SpsE
MSFTFTDKIKQHGVFLVAEIGNNHEGSYAAAEEMVGRAAEAGAHAVKFQTFKTELLSLGLIRRVLSDSRSLSLATRSLRSSRVWPKKAGVLFFSTPLDLESAEFLNGFCPLFKVASGDNNFTALLKKLASFKKPIILSTGMADLSLIARSRETIEGVWRAAGARPELALMHCVSSYPAPLEQANLGAIRTLRERFGGVVGYSDHTLGIEAACASVALGAQIVEKHFTLNKNHSDFRDHQLSADPAEFAALARRVREILSMLGSGEKVVQECEKSIIPVARRSAFAARDLSAGSVLREEDIAWLRPGSGVSAEDGAKIVGKKLEKSVGKGGLI